MKLISFDVETWGMQPEYALQPWRALEGVAGITCFAVGHEAGERTKTVCTWMYDDVHAGRQSLEAFLTFTKSGGAHIVCWNAPFDIAWCLAYPELRDLVFGNKWLDGALVYRRVINSPEKGLTTRLKSVVAQYLPKYAGYEEDIKFDPQNAVERERLMNYNRLDALFTRELTRKFLNEMTPTERRNARIEAACLPMVAEANMHGLTIDTQHLADLDAHLVTTTEKAYGELLAADPDIGTVNLRSPDQVAELLFNKWGLNPVKQTETGNDSTDKETLHELSFDYPLAKTLRTYREGLNNRTKFSTAISTSLAYNGDGVVRPQARVFGTYTGRMTYSGAQRKGKSRGKNDYPTGFALHQMKRESQFRKVVAPPPGYTLVEFDFAGQEYRWMAVMSGDETMLAMCQPGEDAHSFMAANIGAMDYRELVAKVAAGDKPAKELRQLGKVGNLSCQYRTSAKRLRSVARVQYDIPMDEETSIRTHGIYRQTYPGVPQYWKRQKDECKHSRVVWTLAGRKVQLVGEWGWALESTAINFPIQGVGGDQKYLALRIARDYLPKVEGRFYYELHDGLFFIVPSRYAERTAREMRVLLSNLPYEKAWDVQLPIKFPVDVKLGPTWGELKEWKE